MEVIDVVTGSRSASPTTRSTWPVTARRPLLLLRMGRHDAPGGRGQAKTVPNGSYRIELSVLKALGNPNNPAHIEQWSSPNITIVRP